METNPLRQIFYHSRAATGIDIDAILSASKRNNGLDGITGVLFFSRGSFLQVLEGPETSVVAAFERIRSDPWHTDVTVISDHVVVEREFAYWSMERLEPGSSSDDTLWRLRRRLEGFAPDLHHHFFDRVTEAENGQDPAGTDPTKT